MLVKLYNTSRLKDTDLTPVIITYNRAEKLSETLSFFYKSALNSLTFYVLDNASTDNTREIVENFQKKWPTLEYVRHPNNIGGNGNILRAVEYGVGDYLWIIGDDDAWQLDNLLDGELEKIICARQADLIRLGWLIPSHVRGKYSSLLELVNKDNQCLVSLSQLSSTIFKRKLFTDTLPYAYFNAGDFYPHLVPVLKSLDHCVVYSLTQDLMAYVPGTETNNYLCGDLKWFAGWFRTSRFLEGNVRLQYQFNLQVLKYLTGSPKTLHHFLYVLKAALKFESLGMPQRAALVNMITYAPGMRSWLILLFVILSLIPNIVLRQLKQRLEKKGEGLSDQQLRV
jgi:glycosyltransferase involved in cell wall biosynthesis